MTLNYIDYILILYVIYLSIASIVSFILYNKDKRLAIKGQDRVKEKTLLSSAIYGGAIGSFLGRIAFHHKTNKIYFSVVIYLSIIIELLVIAFMVFIKLGGIK